MVKFVALVVAFSSGAFVASGGYSLLPKISLPASLSASLPVSLSPSCKIKGNVSINTGERIYHVPGQKYYSDTVISPSYGERWFCSEAEAKAAGWRKSRV